MLTVFSDYRGVVHYEFLPTGQTVSNEYYVSVMRRSRDAFAAKGRNYVQKTLVFFTSL